MRETLAQLRREFIAAAAVIAVIVLGALLVNWLSRV
jgi:hypothetical protein